MRAFIPVALCACMLCTHASYAFNLSCAMGESCVQSQGASIPSKQVVEILEHCDDFIRSGVGRAMLRMSLKEMNDRTAGKPLHPLSVAAYAFDRLYDSPLVFTRPSHMEDTRYDEVVRSCAHLSADFEKWAR